MLRDALYRIGMEYKTQKSAPLKNDPLADFVRNDTTELVKSIIQRDDLLVTASVGQGNWAEIPWVGIFNPEITNSATEGIYVVYLYSSDSSKVYLCQGQGVTSIKKEFGSEQTSELLRRSDLIRTRVPEFKEKFIKGPISLNGTTDLAKSYDNAVAYFKEYLISELPSETDLQNDLRNIVNLYDQLILIGGTDNIETLSFFTNESESENETIEEKRKYVRHSRIERNKNASKKVKEVLGHTCMGCGFNFKRIYGERGQDYIEAHHLIPLHMLPEGKAVQMDPKEDFAVLCANCHKIVHRKKPMLTLEELQNIKGVQMLRKAFASKT